MRSILLLCFSVMMFVSSTVFAGDGVYILSETKANFLNTATSSTRQTLRLVSPNSQDTTNNIHMGISRQGVVRLIYGRELNTDIINRDWQYRMIIRTTCYTAPNTSVTKIDTLQVEHHNETGVYESIAHFKNLQRGDIQVEILNIEARINTTSGAWDNQASTVDQVPNDIRIETQLIETRYDYLSPDSAVAVAHNYQFNNTSAKKSYIDLFWTYTKGLESVEIEYVFWDSLDMGNPGTGNPKKLFAHASRVETNQANYRIELSYPQGTLYYRVRPVGRFVKNVNGDFNNLQYGKWSSVGTQLLNAFEQNRSWQYTSTFAEEGKQKKVITYFDETSRARQVVTFLNDIQRTLVGETDYSIEGQQVMSILPVPANPQDNNLFFKPAFNKNASGTAYSYRDFDKNGGADPLANTSGAGQYYSANNSNTTDLHWAYIPDAEGYPLSQSRYTRDNTGRVAAQGGVGKFHQLGNGRESRYYYGSAAPTELRRLFGSNVGNATHYDKNLVVDPNGQVSISYVDQTGKTIATALAGTNPSNVLPLPSQSTFNSTVQLIDTLNISNNTSLHESVLLSTLPSNTASFEYDLVGTYNALTLGGQNLCLPCSYELKIIVRQDETGRSLPITQVSNAAVITTTNGSETIYTLTKTFTGAQLQSCSTGTAANNSTVSFQVIFGEIGAYRVRKTLTLLTPPASLTLQYLSSLGTLPDSSAWVNHYISQIDTTQCDFMDSTATVADSVIAQGLSTKCDAIFTQIVQQVSPGGALYNGFVANNLACVSSKTFLITDINGATYSVRDNSGNLDIRNTDNTTTTLFALTIFHNAGGSNFALNNWFNVLTAVNDTNYFQDAWADTLALCHREYCHYQVCKAMVASDAYDIRLTNLSTWANAGTAGLAGGVSDYAGILANDPFKNVQASGFFGSCDMQAEAIARLDNYNGTGRTIAVYIDTAIQQLNNTQYGGAMPTASQDSMRWSMFSGSYTDLKMRLRDSCMPCPYQTDANVIVEKNPIANIQTFGAAQQWGNTQAAENCEITCAARVDYWMTESRKRLDSCSANWSSSDSIYIRTQLANYCAGACGTENPNVYMLVEDLTTDVALQNYVARMTLLLPDPCDTVMSSMFVARDSVYDWARDSSGNIISYSQTTVFDEVPCINTYLRFLQNHDLPVNTNVTDTTGLGNTCACQHQYVKWIHKSGYCYLRFAFSAGKSCEIVDFLLLSNLDTASCVGGTVNTRMCFGTWAADSVVLLQARTTTLACLSPRVWEIKVLQSGVWNTMYLAQQNTQCPPSLFGCDKRNVRYAFPREDSSDMFTINIDSIRRACIDILVASAIDAGMNDYRAYLDSVATNYHASLQNCWNAPFAESFRVAYDQSEYHHTLYYYDQAGSLVQTVPPAGVRPVPNSNFTNGNWNGTEPAHELVTRYKYNSLGQVIWQSTPDAGITTFYYDDVQRLRLSQNAEQILNNQFSFTAYDDQSRISRVGQINNYTPTAPQLRTDLNTLAFPLATGASYTLDQVTQTQYDFSPTPNPNYPQTHLRGRVSTIANANQTTYYSYDVLGNVHTFYQNIVGFKSFRTDYEYDLISGKVNQVAFQAGQVDAQYHKYRYDADLRLRTAYQGTHPHLWTRIARYFYYAHGALARTEIGEQVAGNDFRYSLQGWIMGVNGLEVDTTEPKLDPSKDGFTNAPNPNRWQARDEFAYALGYHDSAYVGIGNPNLGLVADAWNPASGLAGLGDDILGIGDRKGLNNGNIAFMLVNVPQFERQEPNLGMSGFAYQYDQLHRIRQSIDYRVKDGKNWEKADLAKTAYTYDPNGNILTLQRTAPNAGAGSGSTDIDDLGYFYNANTNQLRAVDDRKGAPHAGFGDIGNTTKYYYNAIGQLVRDDATISSIDWNIQGKVDLVKFGNGNPNVAYTYDPLGNRLTKKVADTTTYYIRDAQGNSFATYKKIRDNVNNYDTTRLIEQYLYASSRLGVRSADIIVKIKSTNALLPDSARCFSTAVGAVSFEQTNHLGDVVVTLSDKVLGADVDADNTIDYYKSIVKSASLSYPFGWDIPNRKFSAGQDYRFGFNGQEIDKSIFEGAVCFKYRLEDPRVARFFSPDPIESKYPELTPYQIASNSPIYMVEIEGLEGSPFNANMERAFNTVFHGETGALQRSPLIKMYIGQAALRNYLIRSEIEKFSQIPLFGIPSAYPGYNQTKGYIGQALALTAFSLRIISTHPNTMSFSDDVELSWSSDAHADFAVYGRNLSRSSTKPIIGFNDWDTGAEGAGIYSPLAPFETIGMFAEVKTFNHESRIEIQTAGLTDGLKTITNYMRARMANDNGINIGFLITDTDSYKAVLKFVNANKTGGANTKALSGDRALADDFNNAVQTFRDIGGLLRLHDDLYELSSTLTNELHIAK